MTRVLAFESEHVTGRVAIVVPARGYVTFDARVQPSGPLVVVADAEVPRPRQGLELRAEGLWAEMRCETPFEHWGYGLEAFGLALDEPAVTELVGDRIPVGWDLEWEVLDPPVPDPDGRGYHHDGIVHGEVLVGPDRVPVDGRGRRTHRW